MTSPSGLCNPWPWGEVPFCGWDYPFLWVFIVFVVLFLYFIFFLSYRLYKVISKDGEKETGRDEDEEIDLADKLGPDRVWALIGAVFCLIILFLLYITGVVG